MNIKDELLKAGSDGGELFFNNIEVAPDTISAVLINEVVPADPQDDFYGGLNAAYLSTAIPLFQEAGIEVNSVYGLLEAGIYITNAVKTPKSGYAVERGSIEKSLPYLEKELSLFPRACLKIHFRHLH